MNKLVPKRRILIMAGGTGGHIFPALAVAEELKAQGVEVFWLGTKLGMEAQLVPAAKYPIYYISISGFRRKGWLSKSKSVFGLVNATWQAMKIIKKVNPTAVLGMGGFTAGPGGLAARLLRKSLLIHEQNSIAGLTNRILAHIAQHVMQAYPETFKHRWQPILTGNPIRKDILTIASPEKRMPRGKDGIQILIIGGSQGALAINEIVPAAIKLIPEPHKISIWHQCGQQLIENCKNAYVNLGCNARVDAFIHDMVSAYEWADLVICRAGALTVAELTAVGVASILIPYPYAVDDHQTHNAKYLVANQAAILMPQGNLTATDLANQLISFINEPHKLLMMAQAARKLRMGEATKKVASYCLGVSCE